MALKPVWKAGGGVSGSHALQASQHHNFRIVAFTKKKAECPCTRPSLLFQLWSSNFSTFRNAFCGISTDPIWRIFFFPSFCFSSSFFFLEISPP